MKNKLITRFYPKNGIIYLRVTINGARAEISTNCRLKKPETLTTSGQSKLHFSICLFIK